MAMCIVIDKNDIMYSAVNYKIMFRQLRNDTHGHIYQLTLNEKIIILKDMVSRY